MCASECELVSVCQHACKHKWLYVEAAVINSFYENKTDAYIYVHACMDAPPVESVYQHS